MAEEVDDSAEKKKRTDNGPGVRALTIEEFDNKYRKKKRFSLTPKRPSIDPVESLSRKV